MWGCASTQAKMTVNGMKPLMKIMSATTNRNSDIELVRQAMPAMLIQMDGLIEVCPEDRFLLASASEANLGYAFSFVEDTERSQAKKLYRKARQYALQYLKLNEMFALAIDGNNIYELQKALRTIHKRDVAALYFAANSWLSWINMNDSGDPNITSDFKMIETIMERILVLDETFNYGGVHALWGVYYASRPEMFGGRPELAQYHFQEAFDISGSRYLLWHYLYARYYAVETKDRLLFVDTLNKIISTPEDTLPEKAFINAVARHKALELLGHIEDYF